MDEKFLRDIKNNEHLRSFGMSEETIQEAVNRSKMHPIQIQLENNNMNTSEFLKQAYKEAQERSNLSKTVEQEKAIEDSMLLIQQALEAHKSSGKEVKLDLIGVPKMSKRVCELLSGQLHNLGIHHSFIYYGGCQREAPEAIFRISL